MKEIKLSSGKILKIGNVPFAEAKDLFQSILEVSKGIPFDTSKDYAAIVKDVLCFGFSSKKIETCLWVCLARCTYNDLKIVESTFEPMEAREDFIDACMEVAQEVLAPFMKSLYAKLNLVITMMQNTQV
jgi:hypothetical protein